MTGPTPPAKADLAASYLDCVRQALECAGQATMMTNAEGIDPAAVAAVATIGGVYATLALAAATRLSGGRP